MLTCGHAARQATIEITSNRLIIKILIKDIMKIETLNQACYIQTVSEIIKSYHSLDEIQQQLGGYPFLRTHRSYIVNLRYVKDVKENDFVLTDGTIVPIRRSDKLAIKQKFRDYVFKMMRGM